MRLSKNLMIYSLILLFLLIIYFIIHRINNRQPQQQNEQSRLIKIWDYQYRKINQIIIRSADQQYFFSKEINRWQCDSPDGMRINSDVIDKAAGTLASLFADKTVELESPDLSPYGLNQKYFIAFKVDNSLKTLEIGNETPLNDGYYVKITGENKLYIISRYIGKSLKLRPVDFMDKTILAGNGTDIDAFTLIRQGKTIYTVKKDQTEGWILTYPVQIRANEFTYGPIFDKISRLQKKQIIELNALNNLDAFGLKKPGYIMQIIMNGQKTELLLGDETPDRKEIYASYPDDRTVFTIDLAALNFIDMPYEDMADHFIYLADIRYVRSIVIEMDQKTIHCEINLNKKNSDQADYLLDGKNADIKDADGHSLFKAFYQALIGLKADKIDLKATPVQPPEITIIYQRTKTPTLVKLEFVPLDNTFYYVIKNNTKTGFIILKEAFSRPDGVRVSYQSLMQAMK